MRGLSHARLPSVRAQSRPTLQCEGSVTGSVTPDSRVRGPSHARLPSVRAQSRPTLGDPVDCSPPSCSAHKLFQARILEWAASSFSIKLIKR